MGDFNYPDIRSEVNSAKYGSSRKFLAYVTDNFLVQKVEETRGLVMVDWILTNREDIMGEVPLTAVGGEGGGSYHVLIEFLISKEAEVDCSCMCMLDFKTVSINSEQ